MTRIQSVVALLLGFVFVLVGILGFVPELTPNGFLLGIFAVMGLHSLVHLVVGILGIGLAFSGQTLARLYNQVIGVVYLLLAILGFVPGLSPDSMLLGLVHINLADNILHLGVGIAALAVGLFFTSRATTAGQNAQVTPAIQLTPDRRSQRN